jgi:hypothetical protein
MGTSNVESFVKTAAIIFSSYMLVLTIIVVVLNYQIQL